MSKIIHFSEETEITIKDVVDSMTDLQREAMPFEQSIRVMFPLSHILLADSLVTFGVPSVQNRL